MTAAIGAGRGDMEHAEAWDAIPWLVNGTLSPHEATRVRDHVGRCGACASEVDDQRRLAAAVAATAPPEPGAATSWQAIEARLGPQDKPAVPAARAPGLARMWDGLRGLGARRLAGLSLGGGLVAAMLVLVVVPAPRTAEYETLTEAGTPAGGEAIELRVRPAPGADPERVRAALEAAGAAGVEGPSAGGLLRAHVPAEARDAALAALRADPLFLVVAAD